MTLAATALLPDQDRLGHSLSPALRQDMARMFRQLGVQQLRASVADTTSMASQVTWSLSDVGQLSVPASERNLDSVFPGASSTIAGLDAVASDNTTVQKLSPRLWGFAWRVDAKHAIVAEVQYRERRDSVSETDIALVRLVCSAVIRAGQPAPAPHAGHAAHAAYAAHPAHGPLGPMGGVGAHALVWPAVERRAYVASPRATWTALALSTLAALITAWLAFSAVPKTRLAAQAQQEQFERVRKATDATLVGSLSQAMATGDYGEVQATLSSFASLGYFDNALVANAKGKVVALAGPVPRQRIGDPINGAYAGSARALGLAAGPEGPGQVLLVEPKAASFQAVPTQPLSMAAQLGFATALGLAALAAWSAFRHWRQRPRHRLFNG
jgi:hypothetical protein